VNGGMEDDDSRTGYANPPKEHRWKKGQSGNPRRQRAKPPESTVAMIDRLLAMPVHLTINGEAKKVTALEAIIFQLLQKEMSGNQQAARTLLKYREFASRNTKKKLEITFLDNPYTNALSSKSPRSAE
jgi:hypothetical protein